MSNRELTNNTVDLYEMLGLNKSKSKSTVKSPHRHRHHHRPNSYTEGKSDEVKIHPAMLKQAGQKLCDAALSLARDIRAGTITDKEYDQTILQGPACCLAAHISKRSGVPLETVLSKFNSSGEPNHLFSSRHTDPQSAASALERTLFHNSSDPWNT